MKIHGGAALALVLAAMNGAAAPTENTPPGMEVTASCERKATKGRVICDVELEVATGMVLRER